MGKANKIRDRIEQRTSWKVVVTYLFVIALCCAMFYYINDLSHSVENQRTNIKSQNEDLEWANMFTQKVHEAQNTANLIAFSNKPTLIRQFAQQRDALKAVSDSISKTNFSEQNKQRIKEITNLIERKGQISYTLSKQFYDFDPLAEFDRTIDEYQPNTKDNSTIVTTTVKDTIIHQGKKRSFWQRVGDVFNPTKEDSVVQVSVKKVDTLVQHEIDTLPILYNLRSLSDKAKIEYRNKIEEYEEQACQLIMDDNLLSEKISTMLLQLNQEVLDSTVAEITKSEAVIEENIKISTIIGFVTLVLIIIFIILIISDVNKSYKLRRAAEEAKKKTEEVLESRHKLLLSVSHDIKTPLTSIMGNVELLDKTVNEKEINSIEESAEHILNLLTNLLEFSSLEQGKLIAEKTTFDALALCQETANMFETIARQKNLQFVFQTEFDKPMFIISDRLKIKQIISNLISNGIKYTLEGKVEFASKMEDGKLVFDISDTGLGIPQDKIDEVFKPFARIDTYNQFAEGSGYGLSVVKGLVDLLEGEISLESEVEEGTHFTVKIPVEIAEAEPKATDSIKQCNSIPLNILIIDDDNTLLSVMVGLLQKLGHIGIPCSSANDINGALLQTDAIDYIVTDREMGALNGNEILRMFKEANADKPVILMTARVEYNSEKAKEEGFDGFIRKPFNLNDLESIFGIVSLAEAETVESPFAEKFPAFCEMMGNDKAAIQSIMEVFTSSTANDLLTLNTCIDDNDFVGAQALCHKMLPMFTQLEQDTNFLSKMNELRGKADAAETYPTWIEDATAFMAQADKLLEDTEGIMN